MHRTSTQIYGRNDFCLFTNGAAYYWNRVEKVVTSSIDRTFRAWCWDVLEGTLSAAQLCARGLNLPKGALLPWAQAESEENVEENSPVLAITQFNHAAKSHMLCTRIMSCQQQSRPVYRP